MDTFCGAMPNQRDEGVGCQTRKGRRKEKRSALCRSTSNDM